MSSIKQNRYSEIPPESIHGIYGVNYYFQTENNTVQRLQFEVAIVFAVNIWRIITNIVSVKTNLLSIEMNLTNICMI